MHTTSGQARQGRPTWQRLSECPRCAFYRPNLMRTLFTALAVGTVLFGINHLEPVLMDQTSTATWVGTGVSFVVPFFVANLGLLVASHRPDEERYAEVQPEPGDDSVTWGSTREAVACVVAPRVLRRTLTIALVVGTAYFCVNQLVLVLRGEATTQVWVSGAITYLVPFTVSNVGVLIASRRTAFEAV